MKHWKTTLGGVLYIAGTCFITLHVPGLTIAATVLQSLAVGWLGYHAKDKGSEGV